jgi:hypothetical protein
MKGRRLLPIAAEIDSAVSPSLAETTDHGSLRGFGMIGSDGWAVEKFGNRRYKDAPKAEASSFISSRSCSYCR